MEQLTQNPAASLGLHMMMKDLREQLRRFQKRIEMDGIPGRAFSMETKKLGTERGRQHIYRVGMIFR